MIRNSSNIDISFRDLHLSFTSVGTLLYAITDIFDVRDEKLFSAMCNWSSHCLQKLHNLLLSERDTGHDLRRSRHSYQLVCYNSSSTRHCFIIRMLYDSL